MAKDNTSDNNSKITAVKVQPLKEFKIPIDLMSKTVMKCSNFAAAETVTRKKLVGVGLKYIEVSEYKPADNGGTKSGTLRESRKKNIYSDITISNYNPYPVDLGEFYFAVLNACINEKKNGNFYTTANRIFHILGGGHILTSAMRKAILNAVETLNNIRIKLDIENAVKKNIVKSNNRTTVIGSLLPSEQVSAEINGVIVDDSIHLLNGGAIINNAGVRNQFVTCDIKFLNPPVRATIQTISINHYFLRRTLEIKGSHDEKYKKRTLQLKKIIMLDDFYKKIGLTDGTRKQKFDARKIAIKILDFFVAENLLKDYSLNLNDKGEIYSIAIDF